MVLYPAFHFAALMLFTYIASLYRGSVNGDRVVEAWGINYLLSFFYSVMVVECIKVFVFKVLYL